jgi:flagellar biosynthesis/type III secretory pathway protein FliH
MSSSDYLKHLTLVDLQQAVPPPATEDFTPQSEFPKVQSGRTPETTPEEAYRNGLAEGEQRGRAAALKELEPVLDELRSLTASMTAVRRERLADAESELAGVAAEAARRILHGELEQADDIVLRMTRACIEEAAEECGLVLHVAPSNMTLVRTHLPEFELDLAEGSVQLQANPSLSAGSVILETSSRCYDGRPERIREHAIRQVNVEQES